MKDNLSLQGKWSGSRGQLKCHCKYSSILYRFWVIWRRIISWPWNLGYRSLMIIQNGTIRKLGCGFLFAFYSNYGSILHQFQNKARYWSQIVIFSYPSHWAPQLEGPCRNIAIPFGMEKLEWWGYPMVKKFEHMCSHLHTIPARVWQTDGRTDRQTSCHGIVRAKHTRRAVKMKNIKSVPVPIKEGVSHPMPSLCPLINSHYGSTPLGASPQPPRQIIWFS